MALLLYWKERGLSSHKALAELSRTIGHKRKGGKSGIGHSGTLDPFAEGLLLVGVGEGTKLLSAFTGQSKTYIAEFDFAHRSESYDTETEARLNFNSLEEEKLRNFWTQEKLEAFLKGKIGKSSQVPPMTSAVHVDGKRAYEWAREGVQKELKARDFEIFDIKLLSWSWPILKVELKVSAGTYIRSLARDWGTELLGKEARLSSLVRISVGPWRWDSTLQSEKSYKYLNIKDISKEFELQQLSESQEKLLKNGSWQGEAQKRAILLGKNEQPLAWVSVSVQGARLERVFLEDPLKILE